MSESFTIRVSASDSGADLLKAVGEDDFGETGIEDTTYSTYYELSYTVNNLEDPSGNQVVITVHDRVGNTGTVALLCAIDIDAPSIILLTSLDGTEVDDFVYYNSGNGILYYSNDQVMSDSFTVKIDVLELKSGVENVTGSLDFGETPSSTDNSSTGTFDLIYTISQSETAGGDNKIIFYAYDNVGNVNSSLNLTVLLDNTPPTNIIIQDILEDENSEYLYYSASILYYSNSHSTQSELFTVNITSEDTSSGLLWINGSTDFGETPSDTSYSQGYEVSYTVSYNEEASGDQIALTVYDQVKNSDSVTLNLVKDNTPPSAITFTLDESNEYLYYDETIETLYYSNDQSMTGIFTLTVLSQDNSGGADLQNLTGSTDFGETPFDTSYSGGYVISYTISQTETGGTNVTFYVYDNVGNLNSSVILFLYYNNLVLYYSNDQAMGHNFTIQFTTSDSEAGLQNATGSSDFGSEVPLDTSYSGGYELSYNVSQTETAGGDNQIIITVYDRVGNSNTDTLSCTVDNTAPILPSINSVFESSDYLYYNDPTFYYSNDQAMSDSFIIQFTTSDSGADLQNATGSSDFGLEVPVDTSYSS
ncbi:MAG: hypothetical protein ACW964_15655, partial [Candidatus Hodarchaeales archaeon]